MAKSATKVSNLTHIDIIRVSGEKSPAGYFSDIPIDNGQFNLNGVDYPFDILMPVASDDGKFRYIFGISPEQIIEDAFFVQMRKKVVLKDVVTANEPGAKIFDYAKVIIIAVLLWMAQSNSSEAASQSAKMQAQLDSISSTLAKPLVIGQ